MKLKDYIAALQQAIDRGQVDEDWEVCVCSTEGGTPSDVDIERKDMRGKHYVQFTFWY